MRRQPPRRRTKAWDKVFDEVARSVVYGEVNRHLLALRVAFREADERHGGVVRCCATADDGHVLRAVERDEAVFEVHPVRAVHAVIPAYDHLFRLALRVGTFPRHHLRK